MCFPDEQLVGKVIDGDLPSFGVLIERHESMISAFAYAMLGDAEEVKDITQEVFLRAFESLKTLNDRRKFKNWLLGISRITCLEWLKKRKPVLLEPKELSRNLRTKRTATLSAMRVVHKTQ